MAETCDTVPYEGDVEVLVPPDVLELVENAGYDDDVQVALPPELQDNARRKRRSRGSRRNEKYTKRRRPRKRFDEPELQEEALDIVAAAVEKLYPDDYDELVGTLEDLPVYWHSGSRRVGALKIDTRTVYEGGRPVELWYIPGFIEVNDQYEMTDDQLVELLVHEYCHVIDVMVQYVPHNMLHRRTGSPHGPVWKRIMRAAGQNPRAQCADPEIVKQAAEKYPKRRRQSARGPSGRRTSWVDEAFRMLDSHSTRRVERDTCRKGSTVLVGFRRRGQVVVETGKVTRCNPKTATVSLRDGGRVRAPWPFLRHAR